MCKVVLKEFKAVVMKNKGMYSDFAELVPQAAQRFLEQAKNIQDCTGTEVSFYESPKNQTQLEGAFYVGLLVSDQSGPLPEGMEYIGIQHTFAVIKGKETEMGNLYSKLDNWIVEQCYKHDTADHLIVEVYNPVENDIEDVEVFIPVKK